MFTKEMQRALEADGKKLRQLTGEDHGPYFDEEPIHVSTCEPCGGTGTIEKHHPFPDDPDFEEVHRCEECGGSGRVVR